MGATIQREIWRIPQPIDLVVGVPRSGLLAANMLSLILNLPVADLEGFCAGRILASGKTRRTDNLQRDISDMKRVVVIDDSIFMGSAMQEARRKVAEAGHDAEIIFVAVYGNSTNHPDADIVLEAVPQPRAFQWNIMHHGILEHACLDIDGVLCVDPNDDENDDGTRYLDFLENGHPLSIPTRPVGALVTSRLEKYRPQTEAWMRKWGVEYRELHMLDLPDMATRRRLGAHGSFKAEVYAKSDAILFIESNHEQAIEIATKSGKPALCMCCAQLMEPEGALAMKQALRTMPKRFRLAKTPLTNARSAKIALRRAIGDRGYERLKRLIGR